MRALLVLLTVFFCTAAQAAKPNIVVVMLDDARASDMLESMPRTMALLGPRAVRFTNAFANVSICGPARATFLTGRYAHNTGVHTCEIPTPDSGWTAMKRVEHQTLAVWLKAAGYRTALIGKYMNGYNRCDVVPAGWTTWAAWCKGSQNKGWGYTLSDNGVPVTYGTGDQNFATDVLAQRGVDFIRASSAANKPFFLMLTPSSGHAPWAYPARHAALYPAASWPGPVDTSQTDLPSFLQTGTRSVDMLAIDDTYRRYLRSIASADEAVEDIFNTLRDLGKLPNTWVIVTSDQGYHFGEHNLPGGKLMLYDTDMRLPLLVRGPGLTARTDDHLLGNVDFAPTIMRLAGLAVRPEFDGQTFRPLLLGLNPATWREGVLMERWHYDQGGADQQLPAAKGVRTSRYTFIQWDTGDRELYDNDADPNQLNNIAGTDDPSVEDDLAALTTRLSTCAGAGCR